MPGQTNPVRDAVRAEILSALAGGQSFMSHELYSLCQSAVDPKDVARVAHELVKKGLLVNGEKAAHPLGMSANTYRLPTPSDPLLDAAKPVKSEAKINPSRQPAKKRKPPADHPFQAPISPKAPRDAFPAVSPVAQTTTAPQMAAEGIHHHILEEAMSEDPLTYIPDPDSFTLEPKEPEAEEDIDSELIDALQGLAEFVPLPQADDDDVLAMASTAVSEIAQALKEKKTPEPLLSAPTNKSCQCLRINNLPPLPDGYVYGGIKVWIEAKHDVGHISISTHDEGGGPFCSLKASGHLSFDSGDLVAIGRVSDALIKLHASMDVTGA